MDLLKFGDFVIDGAKRRLFKHGSEIKLGDRDFEILLFLVRNRQETQSKGRIIEHVWNGMSVEDNSVERAIVNIRKALGDDAGNPTFIKTVWGKGYHFVGDVEKTERVLDSGVEAENPSPTKVHVVSRGYQYSRLVLSEISVFSLVALMGIVVWASWENVSTVTVFSDDFRGKVIDTKSWSVEGSSVRVHDGIARVSIDRFKGGGKLVSEPFSFDTEKPLKVKSRTRVSYNQSMKNPVRFVGAFGLIGGKDDSGETFVGLKYTNTMVEFHDEGEVKTEGFYLVKDAADILDDMNYCNGKIGPRTDAVWGEWFEQELVYEPETETLKYFLNNEKQGEFHVGTLKTENDNTLRLVVHPQGTYLYHAIEIDYVEVRQ